MKKYIFLSTLTMETFDFKSFLSQQAIETRNGKNKLKANIQKQKTYIQIFRWPVSPIFEWLDPLKMWFWSSKLSVKGP